MPFYSATVKDFLRRYGNAADTMLNKTCDALGVDSRTRLSSLENGMLKLLSLNCTLSHTKNVVIDLLGVGSLEYNIILQALKQNVDSGGSVIILDHVPDLKYKSNKFINIEVSCKQ